MGIRIVNYKRFVTSMIIMGLILVSLFTVLSNFMSVSYAKEELTTVEYRISSGESLWSVADRYYEGKGDIRDMIVLMKQLNNLQGDKLMPGMILEIPLTGY